MTTFASGGGGGLRFKEIFHDIFASMLSTYLECFPTGPGRRLARYILVFGLGRSPLPMLGEIWASNRVAALSVYAREGPKRTRIILKNARCVHSGRTISNVGNTGEKTSLRCPQVSIFPFRNSSPVPRLDAPHR